MNENNKSLFIFIVIYSTIFFLLLPILFMDWNLRLPHIFGLSIGAWYLLGLLILCILVLVIIAFNKIKKENRFIIAIFLIIYIIFESLMFFFSLLSSGMGKSVSRQFTFFSVFVLFGILAPIIFYVFLKRMG